MNYQHVTLVYPDRAITRTQREVYLHLPYSSLCLAAYIREHGYKADILDMRVKDWKEHDFSRTDVVGIGCMTGNQIKMGLELASLIRQRHPDMPIVWGGVHPTLYPKQTCEHPHVDYVVRGEGEVTFLELLEALNGRLQLKDVNGITYMRGGEVLENPDREPIKDLDTLPFPAYDLVVIEDYPNVRDIFDYQSSRGCPYRCSFCYNLAFNNRRWRAKSPDKTISEIKKIKELYDVRSIGFVDDELFINIRRTSEIVKKLVDADLDIGWIASCRLDILQRYPDETMELIKASGCSKLYFGAESGSQKILDHIKKDITVSDIFNATKKCLKNNITPILSFMSGFPDETFGDLKMTHDTIEKLLKMDKRVTVNGVFVYNPYPGGELFEDSIRNGIETPSAFEGWGDWDYKYDASHPWIGKEKQNYMKMLFLLVRFSYYWKELGRRNDFKKKYVIRFLLIPLKLSFALRWKRKLFSHGYEWHLWSWFMRNAVGYL